LKDAADWSCTCRIAGAAAGRGTGTAEFSCFRRGGAIVAATVAERGLIVWNVGFRDPRTGSTQKGGSGKLILWRVFR